MPGSGGGKTSTSSTSSPYAPMLAQWGNALFKNWMPVQSQLASQMSQALQTGGVNAQIPIINRAVSAQRQAASQSDEQMRQDLARMGLGNSSYGQAALEQQRMQEGENIANVGPDLAMQFISAAPGAASTGTGQAIGAGSSAIGGSLTTKSTPSFWDTFMQGLSAGGQAVGGIGMGLGPFGFGSFGTSPYAFGGHSIASWGVP